MLIKKILEWFEGHAFGVCSSLGRRLGIKSTTIRMYFVYLSFFTLGSPIILYFFLAFLKEHKDYFRFRRPRRPTVWDI